jgi:ethanolaminephosphotransferase
MIGLFILHRILQRWNQTGQKFAGSPDIVTDVLYHHPVWMWSLVIFTYATVSLQIGYSLAKYLNLGYIIGTVGALSVVVPSFVLKLAFVASDAPELLYLLQGEEVEVLQKLPMVHIARGIFFGLTAFTLLAVIETFSPSKGSQSKRKGNSPILTLTVTQSLTSSGILHTLQSLTTLLLITQTRTHNIPLYLLFVLQHKYLYNLRLTKTQITLNTLILGHASFFALGNSNAISSIDLSNGYNGVSGYNVAAVGILVFVSNWAGPIFWSLSGIVLLTDRSGKPVTIDPKSSKKTEEQEKEEKESPFFNHFALHTFFIAGSTLAMMVACTMLRTHLFIWTVFSPKYLYTMAWSLGYHFVVTLALGGGIWSLSKRID